MESNQQRQSDPLTKPQEDKENKTKRRYYGKMFVILIFLLILYEYYVYVYQIMWKKLNGNIYLLIISR